MTQPLKSADTNVSYQVESGGGTRASWGMVLPVNLASILLFAPLILRITIVVRFRAHKSESSRRLLCASVASDLLRVLGRPVRASTCHIV